MMNPDDYKHCKKCDEVYPKPAFAANAKLKDGLNFYCRKCSADASAQSMKKPVECPQCHHSFIRPVKHKNTPIPPLSPEQKVEYRAEVKKKPRHDI